MVTRVRSLRLTGTRLAAGAMVSVMAVAAGCSVTGPASPMPTSSGLASQAAAPAAGELPIVVFRNRADDLRGVFSVKVSNDGQEALRIHSVTLRTAAYQATGAVDIGSTLAAGRRVDLKVPVGPPVCDAGAPAPTATVDLALGDPGDPGGLIEVSREVPADELTEWNGRECQVAATRAAAEPTLVGPWVPGTDATGRDVVVGTLRVTVAEQAAGDVVVTAVEPTVLFLPVETAVPVTAAPGSKVDIAVRLAVGRCDAHAVAEATGRYGFVFPVRVSVAGAEPVAVATRLPEADWQPLFDLLGRVCGL